MDSVERHGLALDVDALAELGWGPEHVDRLAEIGFDAGDLATFVGLIPESRDLVLRLLGEASEADFAELGDHPQSQQLADWLLTLPAYRIAG